MGGTVVQEGLQEEERLNIINSPVVWIVVWHARWSGQGTVADSPNQTICPGTGKFSKGKLRNQQREWMLDDEKNRCLLQWVSQREEKEDAGWRGSAEMLKTLVRHSVCFPEGSVMREVSIPAHLFHVNFSSLLYLFSYLDIYLGVTILPPLTLVNWSVWSSCYTQDIMLCVNK